MSEIVAITRRYAKEIKNGRSLRDVLDALKREVIELEEEIEKVERGETSGPDGVRGESIDVALCALDMIFVDDPETTDKVIDIIAELKCAKWKRKYSAPIIRSEV